ncbi:hypothetical protein QTN25_004139 [Entamoeba marina]
MNTFHSYVKYQSSSLLVDDLLPESHQLSSHLNCESNKMLINYNQKKKNSNLSKSYPLDHSKNQQFFDSRDKALLNLFCQNPPQLLLMYSKIFITKDINPHHIDLLVDYFASRNCLDHLLITLATEEIEKTNKSNELFRGNSTFTKVYTVYLKKYCQSYLQQTSIAFLNYLKTSSCSDIKELQNNNEENDTVNSNVLTYCHLLLDNVTLIPVHLRFLLKTVYQKTTEIRNVDEANKAVSTLLFLRYLFVPFVSNPSLFKTIQSFITKVLLEMSSKCSQQCVYNDLMFSIKQLLITLMKGDINEETEGVDIVQSEKTFFEMINILKENKKKVADSFDGDLNELRWIVLNKKRKSSLSFLTKHFF